MVVKIKNNYFTYKIKNRQTDDEITRRTDKNKYRGLIGFFLDSSKKYKITTIIPTAAKNMEIVIL
jgi:hypothetical protein